MTAPTAGTAPTTGALGVQNHRRLTTETKSAFKTTEFMAYVAAVIAVLIACAVVKSSNGHADPFRASQAWLYVVLLTIGYMLSRGLAKSGSREPYDDDRR